MSYCTGLDTEESMNKNSKREKKARIEKEKPLARARQAERNSKLKAKD